jgi:hypothetical protein
MRATEREPPLKPGDGKPRSEQRQRKKVVAFRVNDDQHAIIEMRAHAAGMKPGDYAREMSLGGGVTQARLDRAVTASLTKLVYELRKIGTNLNQIAHVANATGTQPLPVVFDRVLADLTKTVTEARAVIVQGEDEE